MAPFARDQVETIRVVIPEQLAGIVTSVSPFAAEADLHTVDWAQQHGLVKTPTSARRLAATRPGTLAAHCYPSASQADLCLLADWMSWLFSLDDQNDEGSSGRNPALLERTLTNVFYAAVKPDDRAADDPLGMALRDIFDRIGDRMSPEWNNRFVHHIVDYFTANIWQAAHRRIGDIPDLEEFPRMRRDAGAIIPSFDLIEFVESTTLPAEFYYSRVYQRLLTTAANVVCWTNDLMTLEKELAHDDMHNLVPVLGQELSIPLEESIDAVADRAGREIEFFLSAEAELDRMLDALEQPNGVRTTARHCVAMLRAWMRGHVDWGRRTARYLEVTS
jgi:Terpene synthase family 2, C-terminal metal binding